MDPAGFVYLYTFSDTVLGLICNFASVSDAGLSITTCPRLSLLKPGIRIMKKSTFVLIVLLVIELLLAGGAAFMVWQVKSGGWNTADPAEVLSRILTVAFGAAPIVALPFLIIYFSARRRGL